MHYFLNFSHQSLTVVCRSLVKEEFRLQPANFTFSHIQLCSDDPTLSSERKEPSLEKSKPTDAVLSLTDHHKYRLQVSGPPQMQFSRSERILKD